MGPCSGEHALNSTQNKYKIVLFLVLWTVLCHVTMQRRTRLVRSQILTSGVTRQLLPDLRSDNE